MSMTISAPGLSDGSVDNFADQISELTTGEIEGVSDETLELIKSVARDMEPVRIAVRLGTRVYGHEEGLVIERAVDLVTTAYSRSGSDVDTGIELAAFIISKFGCKFKPIRDFASMLEMRRSGTRAKIVQMVNSQVTREHPRRQAAF